MALNGRPGAAELVQAAAALGQLQALAQAHQFPGQDLGFPAGAASLLPSVQFPRGTAPGATVTGTSGLSATELVERLRAQGFPGAPNFGPRVGPGNCPGGLASLAQTAGGGLGGDSSGSRAAPSGEPTKKPEEKPARCHLHSKPNKKCKFCLRAAAPIEEVKAEVQQKASGQAAAAERKAFNCSPMLKEQVVKSSYYKSLLSIDKIEDLCEEIRKYAVDGIDVYRPGSTLEPSCFMCCVYRLFTINKTEAELEYVVDFPDSVIVRCCGFLFVRYVASPDQLWEMLEEFLLDQAVLKFEEGGRETITSVGEYVEALLLKEKYFNTPLPRVPAGVRRKLEESLAAVPYERQRTKANNKVFDSGARARATPVQVCVAGEWQNGSAVDVFRAGPSRLKLRVQMDDGGELLAHVGKVVLRDASPSRGRGRSRSRSRDRRRERGDSPDWSRYKGKSHEDLVQELRERAREEAVCGNRKGYARQPPRFEAGLALKRDTGNAEGRLIEEETYVRSDSTRRNKQEEEDEVRARQASRRTDEEHERQRKLKDIFDKYGAGSSRRGGASHSANDIEGPDMMRLG